MKFKRGSYTATFSRTCAPKFDCVVADARRFGLRRADFVMALERLQADIGQGSSSGGLERVAIDPPRYGVTIYGYRFHMIIREEGEFITIVNIEDT